MSPEYEGPQDEDEAVAPRRVKHLIVLPGGAEHGAAVRTRVQRNCPHDGRGDVRCK